MLGSNSLVLSKHVVDLLNSVISIAHILVAMFSDCRLRTLQVYELSNDFLILILLHDRC